MAPDLPSNTAINQDGHRHHLLSYKDEVTVNQADITGHAMTVKEDAEMGNPSQTSIVDADGTIALQETFMRAIDLEPKPHNTAVTVEQQHRVDDPK